MRVVTIALALPVLAFTGCCSVSSRQISDAASDIRSVEGPEAEDCYDRGVCYYLGKKGVTADLAEAVKWFRKAAELGHAGACNNLGVCYDHGYGVTSDAAEAMKWYRRAAELGDSDACFNLGICYANGRGVAKDMTEAAKWYRKAAESGDDQARRLLKELEAR